MGGAPPVGGSVEEHFDCLILMAREYQPHQDCFTDIHVHHAPIEDGLLSKEQLVMIFHAAAVAKDFLDSGRKVLVTCYAGLNRSGLVCALAACTTKSETLSLEKAIESIRNARGPSALHNQHFISFLKKWDMARKMKAAGNM
jgi:protein-tyrosine phosphatase